MHSLIREAGSSRGQDIVHGDHDDIWEQERGFVGIRVGGVGRVLWAAVVGVEVCGGQALLAHVFGDDEGVEGEEDAAESYQEEAVAAEMAAMGCGAVAMMGDDMVGVNNE